MATTRKYPARWLDVIVEKAPALRKAGVLRVEVDGFSAELAPYAEPIRPALEKERDPEIEYEDPFDDPEMYGLGPGAKTPGFQRPYSTLKDIE